MQRLWNRTGLVRWGSIHLGRLHGLVALIVLAVSVVIPPGIKTIPKICLFNDLTGLPCPFCGLTRSFTQIGHLHFAEAAQYSLLGIPLFATLVLLVFLLIRRREVILPINSGHVMLASAVVLFAWVFKFAFIERSYW